MEPTRSSTLLEGLIAGILAYLAVAVVFAAADLVLGRALFTTPAVIGGLLFYGLRDPAAVVVAPGPVAAANGLHVLLAVALGLVAALLVRETEKHPQFFYLTFVAAAMFLITTSALLLAVPSLLRGAAPGPVTVLANVAGGLVAGAYLWFNHPRLRARARHLVEDEDAETGPAPAAPIASIAPAARA